MLRSSGAHCLLARRASYSTTQFYTRCSPRGTALSHANGNCPFSATRFDPPESTTRRGIGAVQWLSSPFAREREQSCFPEETPLNFENYFGREALVFAF